MRVRVDYIIIISFYGRYAVPGIRPIESATEFGFWNSEIGIVNYENDLITLAFHTNERPILLQVADVLGPIAMAARVGRRLRADQAAADIGVEGRRRDRELGRGLAGGKVKPCGFFHIDLHNQD